MVNSSTNQMVVGNSREDVQGKVPAGSRGPTFTLNETFPLRGVNVTVTHLSETRIVLDCDEVPNPKAFAKDDLIPIQNYYFRVLGFENATRVALVAWGRSKKHVFDPGDGKMRAVKVTGTSAKKRAARARKK